MCCMICYLGRLVGRLSLCLIWCVSCLCCELGSVWMRLL